MRSLSAKLALAFFVASLPGLFFLAILAARVVAREFDVYVEAQGREALVARLADYYSTKGDWSGVEMTILSGGDSQRATSRGGFILLDESGSVIFPHELPSEFGHSPDIHAADGLPIVVGQRLVGTMFPGPEGFNFRRPPGGFIDRINRNLLLAGVGGAALSLALGILLTRTLTRTLRELTQATNAVAQGTRAEPIPVRTKDELGTLARAFNDMNERLAGARELRKRMTADIAHELRTPLSVILGHAEALSEGVLPASPETFHTIHDEANHLRRLVDDLRTLSMSEAGELTLNLQLQPVGELLDKIGAAFRSQVRGKKIRLSVETHAGLPEVKLDPDRMSQVMGNLVLNSLRHAPRGGRIKISAEEAPTGVRVSVHNNGPSIESEDLEHIFDRFYGGRAKPRRREVGTGLGLAIAKSIVEAHGGKIWAESPPDGGATFVIELPNPPGSG
ncbi:MAG TPA: HAMP domain-containing sensor histidine kinase [Anaerolineales bacterium]|nr:HAMP domain-containing sensor histidine kinase [Anaerolineales bacterium]